MEGSLYKWTNYYSGWQSRWFILDNGVLSYYLSPEEVTQGSRGSVKVASCNIIAHYKDQKRIDVVIKGGRYMYLRASSPSERQKWLVGLGSAKQESTIESDQLQANAVKSRLIELHSKCQLLVTQIATLKTAINGKNSLNNQVLDEISISISTTCDSFLNSLAECMDLTYEDDSWPIHLKPLSPNVVGTPPPSVMMSSLASRKHGKTVETPLIRTPSNGFSEEELYLSSSPVSSLPSTPIRTFQTIGPSLDLSLPLHLRKQVSSDDIHTNKLESTPLEIDIQQNSSVKQIQSTKDSSHLLQHDHTSQSRSQSNSDLFMTPTSSPIPSPPPSPNFRKHKEVKQYDTFFSALPHKFQDIVLRESEGIPTSEFLQCCTAALPFFDALNSTAFSPVKQDINGNIQKLIKKYNEDPGKFQTLQAIVIYEIDTNTHNIKNSATDALLWLKRAMQFIQVFLGEVANGEHSLDVAAGKAYGMSLRRHHNWIVRGVFNLAVKAIPYYNDFIKLLGSDGTVPSNEAVIKDMKQFSLALGHMMTVLNQFYQKYELDKI